MSQKELSDYKKKVMKRGAILTAELATAGTGAGVIGKRAATKAAQKKLLAHLNRREKEITESIKKRMKAKAAAKRGKEAMASQKKRTVKKELQKHMELKRAAAKSKTKPSTTKLKRSQAKKTVDMRKASPHTKYKEAKSLAKREGLEGRVAGAKVTAKGVKRPTVKATTKTGKSLRTKGPGGKTKVLTKKQRESVKPDIKKRIKKQRAADRDREIHKKGGKALRKAESQIGRGAPFQSRIAKAKTKGKGSTKATARKESPTKFTKGQLEQPGGRRRIATSPMAERKMKMARLERAKDKGNLDADGYKLLRLLKRSVKRSVRKGGRKKK